MKKHSLTLIDMSINCDSFLKKEDRLKYLGLQLLIFEIRITVLTLQFHSYHQKYFWLSKFPQTWDPITKQY